MKNLTMAAICVLAALGAAPTLASDEAAETLAGIILEMNHFPSDEQKASLADVETATDVSDHVRAIAGAVARIEHQPTAADKEQLEAIEADETATDAERTLAGAVARFNHRLSADDVPALEDLRE